MKTLLVNRKIIVSIFAVMMLIYGVQGISYGQEVPDNIAEFSDRRLAYAVRRKLGLPTGNGVDLLKIPKAELEKLTTLDPSSPSGRNITDLTGLEHATQLTKLDLEYNEVSDLTPLAQLTQLVELNFYDNNISDLTPLAQLTQLVELNLSSNDIVDVTPLAQLTQLVTLDLWANDISDITPLAQLTQLKTLNLRHNEISDVTPLLRLTSLKNLSLSENPIKDASPLNAYLDANPDVDLDIEKYLIREEGGPTLTATTDQPLTGASLDDAWVTLTLSSGSFLEYGSDISKHLTISGIPGIGIHRLFGVVYSVPNKEIGISLWFSGDTITTDSVLTLTVGPKAIQYYNGDALTVQIPVKGVTEAELAELSQAMVASTPYPLTEATLNGSIVTLRLTRESYFFKHTMDRHHVKVSGIAGVTIARYHKTWSYKRVKTVSDTEITVELRFSGSISKDATLKFTVEPDVIWGYNGPPRTAEIPVSATTEVEPTGELVASPLFPLTKATLDGSFVVLTLQNDSYSYTADEGTYYHRQVGISGIGNIQTTEWGRLSRSELLVKVYFQGDFNTDVTLTFTVPPSLIVGYNGPPLTVVLPVTVVTELRVLIPELQQQPIFWVNTATDKIESAGFFDAVTQGVESLTVDTAGGKLYWGERTKSGGIIKRASFDGTNVEELVSLSSVPRGIAIDAVGNKLYWTNSDLQIQTATLNGEGISTVIQLEEEIIEKKIETDCSWFIIWVCSTETIEINITSPTDIAVNTADGRLYWRELSRRIRRVNLDGTNLETLVSGLGPTFGITVADGKVYWAELVSVDSGKIQRANPDGTNIETLATVYGRPLGISVDTAASKVYWANSLGGIQRMDINGGEVEAVVSGITAPGDFVLVPGVQPTTPTTVPTDAAVSISPTSVASPAIGEQLAFNLNITSGEAVAGYQATVQFDTTALRYVSSANGDYLPDAAFFVEQKVEGNLKLNVASLAGESKGDGTLATLTFEVIAVKESTLTLSDVLLTDSAGKTFVPQVENAEITESTILKGDVNSDGTVNIADLVLVASNLGETGQNAADVNGDGVVNIADLVLVAGALGNSTAAPSLHPRTLEMLTATEVKQWLFAAQRLDLTDTTSQRGILFLQQLLITLTPKETALLANYPNPFNPETWIPYHLAKDTDVTLHIYTVNGALVRTLALGHQAAGMYQNRSRAAYWNGRNAFGESVASGVYFYTLTAGDFTATRKMLIRK